MENLKKELISKAKALELAKEVEKSTLEGYLERVAAQRIILEQYKKAHCSTDQSKNNEHEKLFNSILPPGTDIDNDQIYFEENNEILRDL